jgi:hypothetical protein
MYCYIGMVLAAVMNEKFLPIFQGKLKQAATQSMSVDHITAHDRSVAACDLCARIVRGLASAH